MHFVGAAQSVSIVIYQSSDEDEIMERMSTISF